MKNDSYTYQSYLVRLWRETPGQAWRVSLQDVMTSKRYNFSDLATMYEFLKSRGDDLPRIKTQREEAKFE